MPQSNLNSELIGLFLEIRRINFYFVLLSWLLCYLCLPFFEFNTSKKSIIPNQKKRKGNVALNSNEN